MTLRLTPEVLRRAYEFLCATAPIARWGLPPGETVEFVVSRDRTYYGRHTAYWGPKERHRIEVSEVTVGLTATLLATLAHEMIHLRQAIRRSARPMVHNAEFRRLAARLCATHGFDPRSFV